MGKTDSTGTYSYLCDGTSPGADVLSDGHALYTPGLSENRGGTASYYSNDRLGNLWMIDGTTKNQLTYEDFSGFGGAVAGSSAGSAFGFGGGNGCQTDADTGLVLMGHRYYDTRIGRFLSQDPIGDGDNWYAYAGNSPTNAIDPTGLSEATFSYNSSMSGQEWGGVWDNQQFHEGDYGTYNEYGPNGSGDGKLYYSGTLTVGPSALDTMMQGGMGLNMGHPGMGGGMIAGDMQQGPKGTTWRTDMGEADGPDMHIYHDGKLHGPETNIDQNGKLRTGPHHGQKLKALPNKLKKVYRPIIKTFLQRAGMAASAIEAALDGLTLDVPIIYFDPRQADMYAHPEHGT